MEKEVVKPREASRVGRPFFFFFSLSFFEEVAHVKGKRKKREKKKKKRKRKKGKNKKKTGLEDKHCFPFAMELMGRTAETKRFTVATMQKGGKEEKKKKGRQHGTSCSAITLAHHFDNIRKSDIVFLHSKKKKKMM